MKKPIKSKYPEKLEVRYRQFDASNELLLAWKTYNSLKVKTTKKNATEEDFINVGQALENWSKAQEKFEEIQTEINKFTNLKFYANRKLNTLEEAN